MSPPPFPYQAFLGACVHGLDVGLCGLMAGEEPTLSHGHE